MKLLFSLLRGGPVAGVLLWWLLAGPAARAQAPAWQSAVVAGSPLVNGVTSMATDAGGNIVLTGSFSGTLVLGRFSLTSAGGDDVFVAKWSPAGNTYLWAQRLGGSADETNPTVAVSGTSVYVAGYFSSATAFFGSLSATNANPGGSFNVFVAKLADAGTSSSFAWVQRAGGQGSEGVNALAVSGTSVYATGTYSSATATFGTTTLTNGHPFSQEVFVAKLTDAGSTGSFAWTQRCGADFVGSVAVAGRNVYVAGSFSSFSADFGGTVLSGNGSDAFVAKLTDTGSAGGFTWVQPVGGSDAEQARTVAVSGTNVYLGGYFRSPTASFGGLRLTNASSSIVMDAFVAKLTDAGSTGYFSWAQRLGGSSDDLVSQLLATGTSVYAVGSFSSPTASFGPITLPRISGFDADIFVAKLTDAGTTATYGWVQQAGGNSFTEPNAAALSAPFLYVAGVFARTAQFGGYAITSPLGGSGFLASLPDPTLTATAAAQGTLRFSLYPNPARAATTVLLPAGLGTPTATLTLLDALGRAIRTATVNLPAAGLRHELDLSGLAPGLYAVQVRAGAATAACRLVVE